MDKVGVTPAHLTPGPRPRMPSERLAVLIERSPYHQGASAGYFERTAPGWIRLGHAYVGQALAMDVRKVVTS